MAMGKPEAGKAQRSLPTSPEDNKMMSSTSYFKVTGMDLILIRKQRPLWRWEEGCLQAKGELNICIFSILKKKNLQGYAWDLKKKNRYCSIRTFCLPFRVSRIAFNAVSISQVWDEIWLGKSES